MDDMTLLEVPYSEKDEAKALGAKWNAALKKWYVPNGVDTGKFARWLPEPERASGITMMAPVYLLKSKTTCWRCSDNAEVFCLASMGLVDADEDGMELDMFVQYSNLAKVPEQLEALLKAQAPTYYPDYSKQTSSTYYLNHCQCGAKLGDFYLHEEPGGAFFPVEKEQAERVTLIALDGLEGAQICAGYSVQDVELILNYGKRQKPSFLSSHLNKLNIFFK